MINNILFDFDGVILDSMPIRDYGFRKIFEEYSNELVEELIDYHNQNGGLSRYIKIKYFYEKLLKKKISESDINKIADQFSVIMRKELINPKYLIAETFDFIKENYKKYNFHIVSGSDDRELNYLCNKLGLSKYFKSISGSPVHKNNLVKNLLDYNNYSMDETILIGDSINDYHAATANFIRFFGYNNTSLQSKSEFYIEKFKNLVL